MFVLPESQNILEANPLSVTSEVPAAGVNLCNSLEFPGQGVIGQMHSTEKVMFRLHPRGKRWFTPKVMHFPLGENKEATPFPAQILMCK